MEGHVEIEHKYEVRLEAPVPGLMGLPGVAAVDPPHELTLQATYSTPRSGPDQRGRDTASPYRW